MTTRKTERILNLTICLLVSDRYLPKSRIREAVEGYHNLSDAAFERTFERDKDELRALGVPIEVGSFDAFFDDEPGYRIRRQEFELPPIDLDAEEAAGRGCRRPGLAARQHGRVHPRARWPSCARPGSSRTPSQLAALEPSVQATEPAFGLLWSAVLDRVRVSFTYRDGDQRTLEPWGMTASKGRWYVIGCDTDRQATRMFKLSRITDQPRRLSRAGAYAVPADLDLRTLARSLAPRSRTAPPRSLSGPARADPARLARRAEPRTAGADAAARLRGARGGDTATGGRWPRRSSSYGADVVVLDPELRDCAAAGWGCWVGRTGGTSAERAPSTHDSTPTNGRSTHGMTSQAQVRRLLGLVPYLREHDGCSRVATWPRRSGSARSRCAT